MEQLEQMNSRFYPYATDSNERELMAYYFAVIAVAVAYAVYIATDNFQIRLPWWIALPSPMAIYLFLRWLFGNYVWRWRILHSLRTVRIPDLNGEYHGHLWTSHDKHAEGQKCKFTITQTWTTIAIQGRFAASRSFNMVTGISVEGTDSPRLTYEYWNEPASGSVETMVPHRGTIWFDIILKGSSLHLVGEYYTGRGRATSGRIEVVRKA